MEEPAEPTEETKHSRGFGRYVLWAGVVLLFYVLNSGPFVMMVGRGAVKGPMAPFLSEFYRPVLMACWKTPLQKPLEMYLRLWCPQMFEKPHEDLGWAN